MNPYILIVGSPEDHQKAFLVVDAKVVMEIDIPSIPLVLMAAFFIFDICYTPACFNFYSFMEVIVMDYSINKAPTSVKHLYTSLYKN